MRSVGYRLVFSAHRRPHVPKPRLVAWLVAILGLLIASLSEAQSVHVEYRVLSETTTDQIVTQSVEVHLLNVGPGTMLNTSATISAVATMPMDPLGQAVLGEVPVGSMVTRTAQLTFSLANESTVRSAPGLLFALTFVDGTGQQSAISAVATRIP